MNLGELSLCASRFTVHQTQVFKNDKQGIAQCGIYARSVTQGTVPVDFGGHDDVANRHILQAPRNANNERHAGIELSDRPLSFYSGINITGADFNKDAPPHLFWRAPKSTPFSYTVPYLCVSSLISVKNARTASYSTGSAVNINARLEPLPARFRSDMRPGNVQPTERCIPLRLSA